MLKRAKERQERELADTNAPRRKSQKKEPQTSNQLTRSKTTPYNKDVCFFCEGIAGYRETLHTVRTMSAGQSLHDAIQLSGNDKLRVKLSSSVNVTDAHAIDIKYHKKCWSNNVSSVLRQHLPETSSGSTLAAEIAAKIEFLTTTEFSLKNGSILNMSELHTLYNCILKDNGLIDQSCSRKTLKQLIQNEIPGIEFHKPKRANESDRVTIKETRDAAIQIAEDETDMRDDMKTLYDAALLLRKAINKSKKWVFDGSLESLSKEHYPEELFCFFRWVISGPNTTLSEDVKRATVHKRTMNIVQSTVSMCLTQRQTENKKSKVIRSSREMPQQLAVGLAIHQSFRSKELVNMLYGFGMSVEYNRLLRVESQIESAVINRMEQNGGLYLPPDIVNGRHVFFAIDNVDFSEDTYDGKNTLHGTAMAIYQRCDKNDEKPELRLDLDQTNLTRSLEKVPPSVLLECPEPPSQPPTPQHPSFGLFSEEDIPISLSKDDFAWILARNLTREPRDNVILQSQEGEACESTVPVWSGYKSMISHTMPVTRVGAPPLIAAPAHEWSTLLTVLMQAQAINVKVVGANRKTVISLDMALYMPAKKLQMARNDLNHLILRPGELHVVMAQLRALGAFIENSGIDMAWVESQLYGPCTVKQILEGKHIKRGEAAHLVTLQAFFNLYQESFLQKESESCKRRLKHLSEQLGEACLNGETTHVRNAHQKMINAMEDMRIIEKMKSFDDAHKDSPMFKVFRHYMRMVMEMLLFTTAVRTADWELHLTALEMFTKYFFAHDQINYGRMIPLYLAEMKALPSTNPEIYAEFQDGNWAVNKNPCIPFCALGADNALEHINRSMKVTGGLVGITLNPSARTKFFLIAPELARLADQAKNMAGISSKTNERHHNLTAAVMSREEKCIEKLSNTIRNFTNPFTQEGSDLYNLVTKVVVPENVKKDLCEQSAIGDKLLRTFVAQRVTTNTENLWSRMKKRKLLTWRTTGKKTKVTVDDKVVELKEDRCLFARMMMVCKSRPEINIKEAIGVYEFSVVPRSLFAADGTMLHVSTKSALMNIIEKQTLATDSNAECREVSTLQTKVSIIDGMAELQSLNKPPGITSCSQLADHFTDQLFQKYDESDEIHLVFDRYDVPLSLKSATRVRRQGDQDPVYYRITDSTHIGKVQMKRLLSHNKTKMELTEYLAKKVLECAETSGKRLVVAWGCECEATHKNVLHLRSTQEEADTKMLLHAVDSANHGATEINIHSPDTDVFILSLRRYPELCEETNFVTGTGQRRRVIKLQPIVQTLGEAKIAALPGLHALSGCDNTGNFVGKGKLTWWKVFQEADQEIIMALANLGTSEILAPDTIVALERFICQLYVPNTSVSSVKELRWLLFRKKQAQAERLPPTQAALLEAIKRANYQAMVWLNDVEPNPLLPSPENFGWKLENNEWLPVMTTLLPAPAAIIHLVNCGCLKDRCSTNRCKCRKAGLGCTDLCGCADSEDACENKYNEHQDGLFEDDDSDDSDVYDSDDSDN